MSSSTVISRLALSVLLATVVRGAGMASVDPIEWAQPQLKCPAECDHSAFYTCRNIACRTFTQGWLEGGSEKFVADLGTQMYLCKRVSNPKSKCLRITVACGTYETHVLPRCLGPVTARRSGYQWDCD